MIRSVRKGLGVVILLSVATACGGSEGSPPNELDSGASLSVLEALGALQFGSAILDLEAGTTLGDVAAEFGGTSIDLEGHEGISWLCFDDPAQGRLLLGSADIPAEPSYIEFFSAGPRLWTGGPSTCEAFPHLIEDMELAKELRIGMSQEAAMVLLGYPDKRVGNVLHYRTFQTTGSGLPTVGELDLLIEGEEVSGLRGFRCHCSEDSPGWGAG